MPDDLAEGAIAPSDAALSAATRDKPFDPELEALALGKSFGGGARVFSDVSFTLERGAAVALVGANGTGKSTLLRCCLGLIRPDSGAVRLFGETVGDLRTRGLRRTRAQVGMVAQRHNLSPRLTALSNVIHGLLGSHEGPRYWSHVAAPSLARDRAMAALERVGLADLALRRADRLSGGQSQRVAIARALVASPRLLIADEPVASLDPAAGEEVMELFFRLMTDHGATVLFTSHHIEHALRYADRVIGLRDGGLTLNAEASALDPQELRTLYG